MELNYKLMGKRIKLKRKSAGISQEKLAELSSLSIPHLSHIETGKTKVSLSSLVAIANALNASLDEIICDSIVKSNKIYSNEIAKITENCNIDELRMIAQVSKTIKQVYREFNK